MMNGIGWLTDERRTERVSRGGRSAAVGMEMVVEESQSEVEEFAGDCRTSESGGPWRG